MKNFKLLLYILIFIPFMVYASSNDVEEISNEQTLIDCLNSESLCKLKSDIQVTNLISVKKEVVLDLNGHTLKPDDNYKRTGGFIMIDRGGKLTINDSTGTGKISSGSKDNSNVWGGIQLIHDNDSQETAELVVNNGTIEGYYYGIVGHGNYHNTKITINNGTIIGLNTEDSVGIYHPQEGQLDIYGGIIKGGSGIEMRSGNLNLENATVEATASKFVKVVTNNGSTTNGVGVAVAQHISKKPINVSIKSGNISGQYAFYEWNPHGNSKTDLDKISLNILGGNFTGVAQGVSTIYSEDFTNFISGGKFNKSVDKYLKADANTASRELEEDIEQSEDKTTKSLYRIWIIIVVFAIIIGLLVFALLKK